jgi:signal transduction histidine kinase
MLRLYLRIYLTVVASLLLFVVLTVALWHFTGGTMQRTGVTLGRVVQNVLPDAGSSPALQQAALQRLAAGIDAEVSLFDPDGVLIASVGAPLPAPSHRNRSALGMSFSSAHAAISYLRLADGRWIGASVPIGSQHPFAFHLALLVLALGIGLAAFPLVRQITKRLERLQHGVESLGAGDLTARVPVEGRDEVARLATSFNRAAGQIEQLVQRHKGLLANASHELRTPLARIRLTVELMKDAADEKRTRQLEQDIAELDWLVDEILLASRLDALETDIDKEDVDLLALAAEECARYDDVHLQGDLTNVPGDARLLRRLLRNLLENARRHGSPPTEVRIARAESGATITVWDHGPGIREAEFDRVFLPFYRPKESVRSAGTGLGLALVRQIARRHGGEARCVAIEPGRSGFRVTLPA